jgi:2-oxoglutarate ferredoxin oxidoreductase subunit alpha
VIAFIDEHDYVFVVEQNESGQLRMLLLTEGEADPKKLIRVLHYDGTPITAGFISGKIADALSAHKVTPIRKQVAS